MRLSTGALLVPPLGEREANACFLHEIAKFPEPTAYYRTLFLALSAAALVYGSLLAFRSPTLIPHGQ